MRDVYKVVLPLVIVVALIVGVELLTAQKQAPIFTIETISSACMTEAHDLDIRTEGNSIIITAPIQTSNPCYSVTGDVKFFGGAIEVDLTAVSKQEICVQCIGEVTGKVVIQNLTKDDYDVKVKTPDKAMITTIKLE